MTRLSETLKRLYKVGLILMGLLFIVTGVIGIRQDDTFMPAKAVIRSIERTYQARDETETDTYEVMVEYTVNGTSYLSDLGYMKNDFAVGKEIDILYNPDNPEAICQPGKLVPIISIIAGSAAVIGASVLLVREKRER